VGPAGLVVLATALRIFEDIVSIIDPLKLARAGGPFGGVSGEAVRMGF